MSGRLGNPFAGMLDIDGVPIPDDRPPDLQLTLPLTDSDEADEALDEKAAA